MDRDREVKESSNAADSTMLVERAARRLLVIELLSAVILAALIISAVCLVPPAVRLMRQAKDSLQKIDALSGQAATTMESLEKTSDQLNLFLEESSGKLEQIDFEGLGRSLDTMNAAIETLDNSVSSLRDFVNGLIPGGD
jgi:predicted PurR-regulated permease PerM